MMETVMQELQRSIKKLDNAISKQKTSKVRSSCITTQIRGLVYIYFKEIQPVIKKNLMSDENLRNLDRDIQDLLRYTQSQTSTNKYKKLIKKILKQTSEIEVEALTSRSSTIIDVRDRKILDVLRRIHLVAAESYEQGLIDLQEEEKLSWRGTAVCFREALRELLDVLAPDEAVMKQPGFRLEEKRTQPTMKQKTAFILKNRKLASDRRKTTVNAVKIVENENIGDFIRSTYTSSSVATHTKVEKKEIFPIRNYVAVALLELLEIKM